MTEVDFTAIYTFKCVELSELKRSGGAQVGAIDKLKAEIASLERKLWAQRQADENKSVNQS